MFEKKAYEYAKQHGIERYTVYRSVLSFYAKDTVEGQEQFYKVIVDLNAMKEFDRILLKQGILQSS